MRDSIGGGASSRPGVAGIPPKISLPGAPREPITLPGLPPREPPSLRRTMGFDRLDINKDGVLSGTEMKGREHLDKNKDGKITKAEFAAGKIQSLPGIVDQLKEAFFAMRDKNQDGVLSGNELRPGDKAKDADGDGQVSLAEFKAPTRVPPMFRLPELPAADEASGGGGGRITVR